MKPHQVIYSNCNGYGYISRAYPTKLRYISESGREIVTYVFGLRELRRDQIEEYPLLSKDKETPLQLHPELKRGIMAELSDESDR